MAPIVIASAISALIGATIGAVLMACCKLSGRADDLQHLHALHLVLDRWVTRARRALRRYPDAEPRDIVGTIDVTPGECRAFLGAFGLEV